MVFSFDLARGSVPSYSFQWVSDLDVGEPIKTIHTLSGEVEESSLQCGLFNSLAGDDVM